MSDEESTFTLFGVGMIYILSSVIVAMFAYSWSKEWGIYDPIVVGGIGFVIGLPILLAASYFIGRVLSDTYKRFN